MVAWLLPAVARTAVTGRGHWAKPSSGSVSGAPEALALALGLALGDALALGEVLLLGGEFAVGLTVGDAVGDGRLEVDALALGSGEAVTLGSAEAVSSFVGELEGSTTIERDSSEADCEVLGVGSSTDVGAVDGVALTRGVPDTDAGVVELALALALALSGADALALAEGSISG